MLNKIINYSIKNKLVIGLFVLSLVIYGGYEATKLPIDAVPDITNNQIQVITIAPSFGATDIERLVTFPIEQANSNISGIKEIRSFSRFGLSLVTIVFNDETDIYWARQQVAERMNTVQSQIPAGIGTPELGPISTGLGEIYQYMVRPKKGYEHRYDATELRTIQDWIVRRQLLSVPGVAEVSSFGGNLKQYEIAINPYKLQSHNLSITDVFNALAKNNQNTGGAYIEKSSTVLFIRSEGLVGTVKDLEQISLKALPDGTPLFLRDIAEIRIGHATRYGAMTYNDKGEVAGAVVMMLKGANSSEVIVKVKERVEQVKKMLPEGVVIEPFLDRSKMVNNAISTVETNLIEGALIVIFVLVLFLGNFRAGLIVASVIPLSMLFAIIMMNRFGVSGNLMSLGALDFGLIVDGAVIIVEAAMHQLAHNKRFKHFKFLQQHQIDEEVKHAAGKMMNSAVFGQIIILIVYLPIFTLQGIEGKMFKPMAQTVAFALLGAFILSLTYVPMITALMLSKKVKHSPNISDKVMAWMENLYRIVLAFMIRRAKWVLVSVVALFVFSVLLLGRLGGEFIPALEEGDFAVDTRVLAGSNINTTIESTQKAAGILKNRFPEVEKVVTKIGSGEVPTDPMPMEAADMMVIMKDKHTWKTAKTFNEMADTMSRALKEVPGITTGFQYPVQMRFNELMTGARQDVVCKIFGENLDTLSANAEKLGSIINKINGAQNLYIENITGMPQIVIDYNRAAIVQYNLSIEDINNTINTAFAGKPAGLMFEGEKRFEVVVRLQQENKQNLEDVQNLLVPTPSGVQIPLYQLASVAIKEGPKQIQREDAKRRIVVGFNVRGRDVESIVNELQEKVEQGIKFQPGYYVTYGGAFENLRAAKNRLAIAVPVSLGLIFLLLYFAFGSLRQGLLIYTAIPLSAIGGIISLWARSMPFSISAGVGFIALFGVAVLNGIVLLSEFNRLRSQGSHNIVRTVIKGSSTRLRPVLMTAYVASLGFLPMALSNGSGAEVQRPLATVVIGGLLVATFLTLYVLPILYIMIERKYFVSKNFKAKHAHALIIALLLSVGGAHAQQAVSVDDAVDIALKKNIGLHSEQLKVQYRQKMQAAYKEVPAANIFAEAGQVNSAYFDNKIGIQQPLPLASVSKAQKTLYNVELSAAMADARLRTRDLKRAVRLAYTNYQYYLSREKLLMKIDTLYNNFYEKAKLKLEKGESNVLEKSFAGLQLTNLQQQLSQTKLNKEISLLEFQLLINSAEYKPFDSIYSINSTADATHPMLEQLKYRQELSKANINYEKAKLKPVWTVGYYNASMKGAGADGKNYGSMDRFHVASLGLSVPIFAATQKAKIKALQLQTDIAKDEFDLLQQKLSMEQAAMEARLKNYRAQVEIYRADNFSNAATIIKAANKQFQSGEINYLDWAMLVNQALEQQKTYLELLKQIKETEAELLYLNSN